MVYESTLVNNNNESIQSGWNTVNNNGQRNLLQLLVEDELVIQGRTAKVFTGSVFGHVPQLKFIRIDGITGVFMITGNVFNSETNVTDIALVEIIRDNIYPDIETFNQIDFGNVIRPTIR